MESKPGTEKYENIVIDTTVLLSSVMTPEGAADAALKKAQKEYTIVQTPETLQELRDKAKAPELDRFASKEDREKLCERIVADCKLVENTFKVEACRDRNDNMLIEAALSSGAKQVVTYDKDLRDMKEYQGITFHSPADFLKLERSLDQKREVFLAQPMQEQPQRTETLMERIERERKERGDVALRDVGKDRSLDLKREQDRNR